jgi:hypothetical protein
MSKQKGTLQLSDAGSRTFGSWAPADGTLRAEETLLVSSALRRSETGSIALHDPAASPDVTSQCRRIAKPDDPCLWVITHDGRLPLPGASDAAVSPADGGAYSVVFHDPDAGDLVYSANVSRDGLLCKLAAQTPVSCSAVIADALLKQGGVDGIDAPPSIQRQTPTDYVGKFHDDEDGDATYAVKTDSGDDGCTVLSVARTPP